MSTGDTVLIKQLDPGLPLPARAYEGDGAVDLCCTADFRLQPGERAVIPTGIAIALPRGYAALVLPRSGLAAKHGITVVNAPGLIDSDYRGEIGVVLLNTDASAEFSVHRGDRIAQLMVIAVPDLPFSQVESLPESSRGDNGFGSSGVRATLTTESGE